MSAPWRVLSRFQTEQLLSARESGQTSAVVSLDLGLTEEPVELTALGIQLADGTQVSWPDLERINEATNSCFALTGTEIEAIRLYSEKTAHTYQLMPTARAPALLISGFVMHRFRDVSPEQGAKKMVQALSPIRGRLLDTATGLGYAAIEAARGASEVVTIELDDGCQQMLRKNPWSAALLTNPKITQLLGDSSELIQGLESESFGSILHDPPAINVAGELYSEQFYTQAHRVLGRGGKMFHYVGDPASPSGRRTTQGVVKRLKNAGFSRVTPAPEAFGVLARK